MARAMSASGEWNPKARRVISRSLVLRLSTLALDSPCIAIFYFGAALQNLAVPAVYRVQDVLPAQK